MGAIDKESDIEQQIIEASRILGQAKRNLHSLVNAAYDEGVADAQEYRHTLNAVVNEYFKLVETWTPPESFAQLGAAMAKAVVLVGQRGNA